MLSGNLSVEDGTINSIKQSDFDHNGNSQHPKDAYRVEYINPKQKGVGMK